MPTENIPENRPTGASSSGGADYKKILKRVSILPILTGCLGFVGILCFDGGRPSLLSFFIIIAIIFVGVDLWRGRLTTAYYFTRFLALSLGGVAGCCVMQFLVPAWRRAIIDRCQNDPGWLIAVVPVFGMIALFIWAYIGLRSPSVLRAYVATGHKTAPPRMAWVFAAVISSIPPLVVLFTSHFEAETLRSHAEQGDARSEYNLGVRYYNGEDVEQNYSEALKWFRQAADQGEPHAQFNIGVMYRYAQGVKQDYAEAFGWYNKAASHGHSEAEYALASMYHDGDGVLKDNAEAARWMRKSADHGYAEAQYVLGMAYSKGESVPQDDITAYMWLSLSADQDNDRADEQLDSLKAKMAPEQIAKAKELAAAWKPQIDN